MEHPTYLLHYGIPGMKWGVRRYQNPDGTWTEEGKERRRVDSSKLPHYGGKGIQAPLNSAGYYKRDKNGFYELDNKWSRVRNKKIKGPQETDYVIKKGSIYKRATSKEDENFNKRIYVGGGEKNEDGKYNDVDEYIKKYADDLKGLVDAEHIYVNTLETKRDTIIAGKNTVESILKEIGGKNVDSIIESLNYDWDNYDKDRPVKPKMYDESGNRIKENEEKYIKYLKELDVWNENLTKRTSYIDFLYEDQYKVADQFIKKLKDKGYDGLADPADGTMLKGRDIDPDATIFVNDVLKRTKQIKYR